MVQVNPEARSVPLFVTGTSAPVDEKNATAESVADEAVSEEIVHARVPVVAGRLTRTSLRR